MSRILLVAAVLLISGGPVNASTITWAFHGVTSGSFNNPDGFGFVPPGSTMDMVMTFDSEATNGCLATFPDNRSGFYNMTDVFLSLRDGLYQAHGSGFFEINARLGNCGIEDHQTVLRFGNFGGNLPIPVLFGLNLSAILGLPVASNGTLPVSLPSDPMGAAFFSSAFNAGGQIRAVPEPTTLLLLSSGVAALIRRRQSASRR